MREGLTEGVGPVFLHPETGPSFEGCLAGGEAGEKAERSPVVGRGLTLR